MSTSNFNNIAITWKVGAIIVLIIQVRQLSYMKFNSHLQCYIIEVECLHQSLTNYHWKPKS